MILGFYIKFKWTLHRLQWSVTWSPFQAARWLDLDGVGDGGGVDDGVDVGVDVNGDPAYPYQVAR